MTRNLLTLLIALGSFAFGSFGLAQPLTAQPIAPLLAAPLDVRHYPAVRDA